MVICSINFTIGFIDKVTDFLLSILDAILVIVLSITNHNYFDTHYLL